MENGKDLRPKIGAAAFNGDNLILCRYWQSAWVYGQLDGLPREWLEQTSATMIQPDINVLLDAPLLEDPVGICLKRLHLRGEKAEVYERRWKMEVAHNLYCKLWREKYDFGVKGWTVEDMTQPVNIIVERIKAYL